MRVRWLVTAVAGVGVLAGAGAIATINVSGDNGPAHPRKPPTITVSPLGTHADDGVIASGSINGKAWRLRLTEKSSPYAQCSVPSSGWYADCAERFGGRLNRWWADRGPATIGSRARCSMARCVPT